MTHPVAFAKSANTGSRMLAVAALETSSVVAEVRSMATRRSTHVGREDREASWVPSQEERPLWMEASERAKPPPLNRRRPQGKKVVSVFQSRSGWDGEGEERLRSVSLRNGQKLRRDGRMQRRTMMSMAGVASSTAALLSPSRTTWNRETSGNRDKIYLEIRTRSTRK